MVWTNFHTHTHYSDGKNPPEDYVLEAIRLEMPMLGFSCHAPLPLESTWTIPEPRLPAYCREIQDLKERYRDRIRILMGLEIDYIPGMISPRDARFMSLNLDYTLGSVHFAGRETSGYPWTVDSKPPAFAQGLDELYGGDIQAAVRIYYQRIQEMVITACPTIVAHLDLVKMNNRGDVYFRESESWYKSLVSETLNVMARRSVILEVNTGGITRNYTDEIYPSPWILHLCNRMNIPVTINADAHRPQTLTGEFTRAAERLAEAGYRHVLIWNQDGWKPVPFTASGLSWF